MNKKTDLIGIIGLLLAVFTLLFGDNIYERITGHSVFVTKPVPSIASTATFTLTSQPVVSSPTTDSNPFVMTVTPALNPTSTPKLIPTIYPTSGIPNTYTLQVGEWPFCIARRLDVDPLELLAINDFPGNVYHYGQTLNVPTTGKPFPGPRSLQSHPDQYTVSSQEETVYGVACHYGDVLPQDLATLNGLSVNSSLEVGQILQIP